MNRLMWILAYALITCHLQRAAAQDKAWIVGNEVLYFPELASGQGITSTSLPVPNDPTVSAGLQYQGDVPKYSKYVQLDDLQRILFFVIDGNIYDRDGYLIAAAYPLLGIDPAWNNSTGDMPEGAVFKGTGEVLLAPVPERCGSWYIFHSREIPQPGNTTPHQLGFQVLDMTVPNPNFSGQPGRMGKLLMLVDFDFTQSNDGIAPYLLNGDPNIGLFNLNPSDEIPDIQFIPNRKLDMKLVHTATINGPLDVLLVSTDEALVRYRLRRNGIEHIGTTSLPVGGTSNGLFGKGELEAKVVGTEIRFAHTYNTLIQFPPDPPVGLQTIVRIGALDMTSPDLQLAGPVQILEVGGLPLSEVVLDAAGEPVSLPRVGGLEFSRGGRFLYFLRSFEGIEGNRLQYYDWETNTVSPYGVVIPTAFVDSRLEINTAPDGIRPAIYMCGTTGTGSHWLGAVVDPDNPSASVWLPEAFGLASVSLGQNTLLNPLAQPAPLDRYHLLMKQACGKASEQMLADELCCEALVSMTGYHDYTAPTGSSIWNSGSNPFGNFGVVRSSGTLRIPTGAFISAANMEFQFAPGAVMIIEPGATFISNNCTFTAACDAPWKGIRVEGTTSNWIQSSTAQGRLFLEPGSVVAHAEVGAWTARILPNGGVDPQRFGGIVRSNGATVMDCGTGVRIERFHRRIPFTSIELNNLSSITNTAFRTTEDWMGDANPYAHLYLYDVNGIFISNSSFVNKAPQLFATTERGWGIVGLDAAFTCNGTNPVDHLFQNLSVGVVGSTPDLLERYVVNSMTFKDNVMGIADLGSTGARITRNTFSLLDDENETTHGIILYSSELYTVERNEFGRATGDGAGYAGITFMGTSFAGNQVYDNTYSKLTVGNWVRGQQRNPNFPIPIASGLQMRCGTHIDNVVTHFFTDEAVVQYEQGLPLGVQTLANNEHLSTPACDLNDPQNASFHPFVLAFQNYDLFVNYNYYDNLGSPEQRPSCVEDEFGVPETFVGDWFYDLVDFQVALPFDKERDCNVGILDIEENFQGLMAGSMTGEYEQAIAALNSTLNAYKGTVDLGQKVDVLDAIRQYPAMPSHELRDVLLAHYPLSDEVLKETILRAEPFDPWHLTQVLIANSPLNGWVFQALDESDLLPVYFRHLVKQAQSGEIGVKRLLELEILQRQQEKDLLLTRLVDAWASDTIHAQKADSVMALLNADGTGYGAQGAYLQSIRQGDHTEAASMAGSLNAFAGNSDLIEYGTLLSQADGEWIGLTGNEATLRRMAFDHSPGSGAMAWGALLAMQELDSVPMPPLPGMFKSLMPQRADRRTAHDDSLIGVLPNPASDRIAYTIPMHEGLEQGVLEVFDAHGRMVAKVPLNGRRGLVESTVLGWDPGLYLVRLIVDGNPLGSAKFTVVR